MAPQTQPSYVKKRRIWERIHRRRGTGAPRFARTPDWHYEPPGGVWARRGPSARELRGILLGLRTALTSPLKSLGACLKIKSSTYSQAEGRRELFEKRQPAAR